MKNINLLKKVLRVPIWKGDILITDLEDLEKLDGSDVCPRSTKAEELWINLPCAYGTAKLTGRDCEFPHSKQLANSEDLSGEIQGFAFGVHVPTHFALSPIVRALRRI